MKKLNDQWKQRKKLDVTILRSPNIAQKRSFANLDSSLKEVTNYGNSQNDDEEFLEAVKELEKDVTPKRRTLNSQRRRGERNSARKAHEIMNISGITITSEGTSKIPNEQLKLSSLNLPNLVLQEYEKCGITEMFEWQAECLKLNRVLSRGNLVYSAPTSAGKTLVAEILILKCVVEQKKKALMILPFVAVTREKVYYLQKLFQSSGIRVDGFVGNHAPPGGFDMVDIAICTIEKANGLINKLIESNTLSDIGIVVVDELHMIGDPHRGFLLELLLTKLLYLQKRCEHKPNSIPSVPQPIQIVGMSATLPNLKLLSDWLNAVLYCTDFRPVPLSEKLKIGNIMYCAKTMNAIQNFTQSHVEGDSDHVLQMCLESIASNLGVIIFCPTKVWCERLAESIARSVNELGREHRPSSQINLELSDLRNSLRTNLKLDEITEVLHHLRKSPSGLDTILAKTVSFGVAFHHAGLTFDEREIIEGAFRRGVIKVLTATSTLSSGVNLPARRVIIRTPNFNGTVINVLTYRQMVGRAGRTGLDTEGESILVCSEIERNKSQKLINSTLPPVSSCLSVSGETISSSLKRALLEVIVSGAATDEVEAIQYASCTLLEASTRQNKSNVSSLETIRKCIKFLIENEFVKENEPANGSDGKSFTATPLGRAVLASSLSPDEGLTVYLELERARRCFVLENDLHVIYQVTPLNLSEHWPNMDWLYYSRLWEQLSPDQKRVAECVGVEERFIILAMKNQDCKSNSQRRFRLLRFYSALALNDLVNEVPLSTVALKFNCNRGMLQSLQQSAATFAGMLTVFCHHLGWTMMELVLANFQNRLYFGVQRELCDLVRISFLNAHLARELYNTGIKTIAGLATASESQVVSILGKSAPFESRKQRDIETALEAQRRVKNHSVWIQGREPMSELAAAKILIHEARKLLQEDFGGEIINFNFNNAPAGEAPSTSVLKKLDSACDVEYQNDVLLKIDTRDVFTQNVCIQESSSCSLNLLEVDSSQMSEEKSDLPSSESSLPVSISNDKILFDDSKNKRLLYLSSDSESDVDLEMTSETMTKEQQNDTSESASLFPELDVAVKFETAKDFCSDSIIQRFLNDSADFTMSKSAMESVTSPASVLSDKIEDESQELFTSPVAKSSPFVWSSKSNHALEDENDNFKKRQKIDDITQTELYNGCKVEFCDCELEIRDVKDLSEFVNEWCTKPCYSLAFACEKATINNNNNTIGEIGNGLILQKEAIPSTSKCADDYLKTYLLGSQVNVIGLAISWTPHVIYYVDFKLFDLNKWLKEPMRRGFTSEKTLLVVGYGLKEQLKLVAEIFECLPRPHVKYSDQKVASWLFDQDIVFNFSQIIERVLPWKLSLACEFLQSKQNVGLGMNFAFSRYTARVRASREADLVHQLAVEFRRKLKDVNLLRAFEETEMASLISLVHLEQNGFGVNIEELKKCAQMLKEKMKTLETKAFEAVGHDFNFASPFEVSKVLYSELKLGILNDEDETENNSSKGRKSFLRGTSASLRKLVKKRYRVPTKKTNQDTLNKLKDQHILPSIILSWRKMQSALTKNVIPILKMKKWIPKQQMYRVMSYCESLTATGRVTLSEPDVQMVPRSFTIEFADEADMIINLRNYFIPFKGGVFVGADFSQLELRILAALSQDSKLKSALNNGDDVFKSIAAQWKSCSISEVTDSDRQNAKQICYGMIYGIGAKSLGEQLEIDQDEALKFMEEFKSKYPGVRDFIGSTVEKCRQLGYVETLLGRRRYLKDIASNSLNIRMHGERQAVNSTIQGSAADIFKKALIAVESDLDSNFTKKEKPRLVLQLHDELIYECHEAHVSAISTILKRNMENSTRFSVSLPVKIKVGPSWGEMNYV